MGHHTAVVYSKHKILEKKQTCLNCQLPDSCTPFVMVDYLITW